MRPFTYERATDPHAAVAAASRDGAKFISGGTNLLDLMKLEIERPIHLVDISRLPLKDIEARPDGSLRIGAQASNSDVAADAQVRTRYPVLTQAATYAYEHWEVGQPLYGFIVGATIGRGPIARIDTSN